VSSAPIHMRLLGCPQSGTGWLAPARPRCLRTPRSLGQTWLGHPSPAVGFGVLRAAPEQTDPSSGNAPHWVVWRRADTWGQGRRSDQGKFLFSSGHHQPGCSGKRGIGRLGGRGEARFDVGTWQERGSEQHAGLPRAAGVATGTSGSVRGVAFARRRFNDVPTGEAKLGHGLHQGPGRARKSSRPKNNARQLPATALRIF